MDYLTRNVSENLKAVRHSRNMSLDQVAEQTGVSKSMLAQIEKGTANPSLGVLGKIASGLRIEFVEMIRRPHANYYRIDPEELIPTKELPGQYSVLTCLPYEDSREVELYRISIEPGCIYRSGGHGEKTREYLIVTKGQIVVECHQHREELTEGKIFVFETDTDHNYRNEGAAPAECMIFFLDYSRRG